MGSLTMCPLCHHQKTSVLRTTYGAEVRRVRACDGCGHKFEEAFSPDPLALPPRLAGQFLECWSSFLQPLEEIAARKVIYREPFERRYINLGPPRSGVYFLFDGERLQYVGKASRIDIRLRQHLLGHLGSSMTPPFVWRNVSWIEVPKDFIEEVEFFYIRSLDPPCNNRFDSRFGYLMAWLAGIHE